MKEMDWSGFLRRTAFDAPSPEVLDSLCTAPVLITGAGGSIGAAMALRLAGLQLPGLILLESAENHLFHLHRRLAEAQKSASGSIAQPALILGNVQDRGLVEDIFRTHRPGLVFHAAAYKHVPLLEAQPLAAISNNIFGTKTVADAASACGARMVLLSTDKATEPASVMGATKRVAEEIVLAAGGIALRLGNVLGSSGSVAEIFADQLARREPLTITDPTARRYFLTLDEAVNLLLFAALHSGSSTLLAPHLVAAHSIPELATFMQSQIAPDRNASIRFTGTRPGDKLFERLWSASDRICPTKAGNMIQVESSRLSKSQLEIGLAAWLAAVKRRDASDALAQLRLLVPCFTPSVVALAHARASEGVCA